MRATTRRRRSPTTNPRRLPDGLRTATSRPQARVAVADEGTLARARSVATSTKSNAASSSSSTIRSIPRWAPEQMPCGATEAWGVKFQDRSSIHRLLGLWRPALGVWKLPGMFILGFPSVPERPSNPDRHSNPPAAHQRPGAVAGSGRASAAESAYLRCPPAVPMAPRGGLSQNGCGY